jgi:cytochrome c-type biogenesis protein CcmH/NrfG
MPAAVMIAVLGIVLATYWPALSASATYMDDKFYIGAPLMRHPSWASVKTIFGEVLGPSAVNGYYQPFSLLSVMLDFLDPSASSSLLPFHRTTLLLHLLNVALVVVLLYVLFGNWVASGLLGLLYGVHPLNADALLWIAERKTVLSTGFALGSLVLYVAYAQHARREHRGDWKRYTACLVLYVCALLSKPTALPLVGLLLVLDFWPLRRLGRTALLEKVPFLGVAGVSALVTVVSQAQAGQAGATQVMNPIYLPLVMGYSIGFYLFKTVWPAGLVSDYLGPHPFALTNIQVLVPVVATAAVAVAIVLSVRRTRAWLAGGLFFVVALLPTLGIIRYTSSATANRSMYLPMVGLLLPLAWGIGRLWNMDLGAVKLPVARALLVAVAAVLAAGSASATRTYESHWRDTPTLLRYYLSQAPNDWKLHTRLGNEWIGRRDYRSAIVEFREAAHLNPNWAENHLNLGRALFTVGEYPEAEQSFAAALRQTPNDWRAHILMGMTLARQANLEGALAEFRAAARIAPRQPAPHYNVAETLAGLGRLDEAADAYLQTLRLDPLNRDAQRALDAVEARKHSLADSPTDGAAAAAPPQ